MVMGGLAAPRSTRRRARSPRVKPEHVIFGRARQRKSQGRLTTGWHARLEMVSPLVWDLDMRVLVEWISVNLAHLYREAAEAGREPDDGAAVPHVTSWTRVVSGRDRRRDTVMMRTGFGIDRWWLGEIKGTKYSAWRAIKPYGGSDGPQPKSGGAGRDLLWNVMLQRGYDPQGVTGKAQAIIAATLADWLTTAVGVSPGIDVKSFGEAYLKDVLGGA